MGVFMDELVAQGLMIDHPVQDVVFALSKTSRSMSSLSEANVRTFGFEMDNVIRTLHPDIKDMIVRNAGSLLDTLRIINAETKSGFGGATGSGNVIDFKLSRAADYLDPDGVDPAVRTQWKRYISAKTTATAGDAFITGTGGSSADWSLGEEQAILLMGFINRADIEPKSDAMALTYNSDPMNIQQFNFEMCGVAEQNVVLMEMKQAAMIAPEQSFKVNVRYGDVGYDYLEPVAVFFERSIDMRNLVG